MLANMIHVQHNSKVYIQTGVWNKQRIIDVSTLHEKLGEIMCQSLPGFHALTGCDFNPALFRKGKQRPLQILKKNEDLQKAFGQIGHEDCDETAVFPILEKFICNLYNFPLLSSVNDARFALFLKTYKVNDLEEPFQKKKLQNFDSSTLPPSQAELTQHLLRTKYIATIWKNAHKKILSYLRPETCGWILVEGKYTFKWFDGPQLPSTIQDIIDPGTNEGDEDINAESESNEDEYSDSEGDITSESDSDCECD
ncbi:uncharacterized protein LOC129235656 [Anastrepha obliqua]|uniref:uncharacterized protein LOC129235656 n=1 Tax=Anastrepha obliqua TaxID=95512 RepID=UPI00240A6650|nr:uncharacterized protein LOC129235656 [Anastrepha obliqua]